MKCHDLKNCFRGHQHKSSHLDKFLLDEIVTYLSKDMCQCHLENHYLDSKDESTVIHKRVDSY
jgi:hypothetical protein